MLVTMPMIASCERPALSPLPPKVGEPGISVDVVLPPVVVCSDVAEGGGDDTESDDP
jgi:hypothetical protein